MKGQCLWCGSRISFEEDFCSTLCHDLFMTNEEGEEEIIEKPQNRWDIEREIEEDYDLPF